MGMKMVTLSGRSLKCIKTNKEKERYCDLIRLNAGYFIN